MKPRSIIRILFRLIIAWFFIHCMVICIDGLTDTKRSADVAVILGTKVNEDGTLSERLIKRVDVGIKLYRSQQVKKIMVSGGFGKEGYWEGDKMKEYLLQQGIPQTDIYVDNYGDNTRLTVEHTADMIGKSKSIIVVSQYFHVTRTKMLFRKKGFRNVYSAPADYFEWRDVYAIPREFFAFYTQL